MKINESDPDPEPDPDSLVRGTDPGIRIRIRSKMSRIPNTGCITDDSNNAVVARVRRSCSRKAKLSENEVIFFHFEAKKVCYFLFFRMQAKHKSENNGSETKRTKRKSAISVKV
jgi:hypothetical protein